MMLKVFGRTLGGERHVEEVPDCVGSRTVAGGVPATAARWLARHLPRRCNSRCNSCTLCTSTPVNRTCRLRRRRRFPGRRNLRKQGSGCGRARPPDTVGNPEFNLRLSVQRSAAVRGCCSAAVMCQQRRSGRAAWVSKTCRSLPPSNIPERHNRSVPHPRSSRRRGGRSRRQGLLCRVG